MSFWFEQDRLPGTFTAAGGIATLSDIWQAAKEQSAYVDNTTASYDALYRAYDERIAAIAEATGQTLKNPLAIAEARDRERMLAPRNEREELERIFNPQPAGPSALEEEAGKFTSQLAVLAEKYPDAAGTIKAGMPVERDAEALARRVDDRLAKTMASRDGIGKWAAAIGGGFTGSLRDPLQTISLVAGGGPGAGRTIALRIANAALKEALVNGAVEASFQPQVQAWREQAGLPHGFDEGLRNVLFAAGTAGVLGGAVQGAGEGVARLFRGASVDEAATALKDSGRLAPPIVEALDGNADRAIEALRPIREALPADARGALDEAEAGRIFTDSRPAQTNSAVHERNAAAALRAAQDNSPFMPDTDPDQVARIVDRLAPAQTSGRTEAGPTLQQFLMSAGGVRDFKGELEALGLANVAERFRGRLVRETGMPLDEARRAAAEAGYFSHLYGTADEAMEKSTVNDLLDELDRGTRANAASTPDDGGRAYAESLVSDLVARAGPAVDDELIVKAAELANREGLEPAIALDRVLIEDDARAAARETAGTPLDTTDRTGGLDDPAATVADDMLFSRADLEEDGDFDIPFFDDDSIASPEMILDEIARLEDLAVLVEACRA